METLAERFRSAEADKSYEAMATTSDCMMINNGQKSLPALGFLTVLRDDQQGLFGGYLVLNAVGRPLEFHCTAPVRPNRAQEILYGPTLEPYLYGERIGPTLLDKSKSQPEVVFTDTASVMAARRFVCTPMTLVLLPAAPASADSYAASTSEDAGAKRWRLDGAHGRSDHGSANVLRHFSLGAYRLAVDALHGQDEQVLTNCWSHFADQIELGEPFDRIREAIDEARRGATGA
jgi:hypothetical protein